MSKEMFTRLRFSGPNNYDVILNPSQHFKNLRFFLRNSIDKLLLKCNLRSNHIQISLRKIYSKYIWIIVFFDY